MPKHNSQKPTSRRAKKIVASFGAAMGTMYFAPSLDADVVNLTGNLPGTLSSTSQLFNFIGGTSFDWLQFNDVTGRTITAAGYLNGLIAASNGNLLTQAAAFTSVLLQPPNFSGTATFGFRTTNNQLGWIRIRYGVGAESPIQYLAAAFETIPGNAITVGDPGAAVPEPGTFALGALGLLALGASARRKRRKNVKANVE